MQKDAPVHESDPLANPNVLAAIDGAGAELATPFTKAVARGDPLSSLPVLPIARQSPGSQHDTWLTKSYVPGNVPGIQSAPDAWLAAAVAGGRPEAESAYLMTARCEMRASAELVAEPLAPVLEA
jgi:hypothetical protein